ncbi:MAG: chromosomal replication initiator protein DnaA [Rickettsiaceae bacterium H1]|nr:chromosomal replication initiator protein DnaA [Rickettsiaceae bacterium H1]
MGITTSKFIQGFLNNLSVYDNYQKIDDNVWDSICNKLISVYGKETYESWLKCLSFISDKEGEITLSAPTKFIRDWVLTHYIDNILSIWKKENPKIYSIEITIKEENSIIDKEELSSNEENTYTADNIQMDFLADLCSPLDPRFTFNNFVVGKPNELAFAAAKRVAENSQPVVGSNPLFLYGSVGLGKTHLMHAIAWQIRKNSKHREVVYLSAEKFMYQYITALRNKNIMDFKEKLRSVDVLMVDDVQFISGKDSTQEEFFHTFNSLIDQKKQLIISADRSPSDLDGIEDRIKSRLGWGLVADINDTTFELRMGILQSKIEQMKTDLPLNILEFIAKNISSNVRELEGALNKIVAHKSLVNREITTDIARDILSDLLRSNISKITIEKIQKVVAEYFNIKISDMHSGRRLRNVTRPRQIAMYLCKLLTQKSLPDIGKKFGRDHATVIHANKRVESLISTDEQLAEDVNLLMRKLK